MSQEATIRFAVREHLSELEIKKWKELQKFSDKLSNLIFIIGIILVAIILLLQRWPYRG